MGRALARDLSQGKVAMEKNNTRVMWKSWQRCQSQEPIDVLLHSNMDIPHSQNHIDMGVPCNPRLSKRPSNFFSGWFFLDLATPSLAAQPR